MSAMNQAIRAYRAERRKVKTEQLYREAQTLKRQAVYLEAQAAKQLLATTSKAKGKRGSQKDGGSSGNKPYHEVGAGVIRCPMWRDTPGDRPVFGLRWEVVNDGLKQYRTTVPATMYHDVVLALGELALQYSQEPRLSEQQRRELREYYSYLTMIPACVKDAVGNTKQSPGRNGTSAA